MSSSFKDSLDSFDFDDTMNMLEWEQNHNFINVNEATQDLLLEGIGARGQRIHADHTHVDDSAHDGYGSDAFDGYMSGGLDGVDDGYTSTGTLLQENSDDEETVPAVDVPAVDVPEETIPAVDVPDADASTDEEDMDAPEHRSAPACTECGCLFDEWFVREYSQNVTDEAYCSLKCLEKGGHTIACSHVGCTSTFDDALCLYGFDDDDSRYCRLHYREQTIERERRLKFNQRVAACEKVKTPILYKERSAWYRQPLDELTEETCRLEYNTSLADLHDNRAWGAHYKFETLKTGKKVFFWKCEYPGCPYGRPEETGAVLKGATNHTLKRHLWSSHIHRAPEEEQFSVFMKCRKHRGNVNFLVVTSAVDGLQYPWTPNPHVHTCKFHTVDTPCYSRNIQRVYEGKTRANLNRHYFAKHRKQIEALHGPFESKNATRFPILPPEIFLLVHPPEPKKRKPSPSPSPSQSHITKRARREYHLSLTTKI